MANRYTYFSYPCAKYNYYDKDEYRHKIIDCATGKIVQENLIEASAISITDAMNKYAESLSNGSGE